MLTEQQQELYDQLSDAIGNQGNVAEILQGVSKDDFLSIFREEVSHYTLLGIAHTKLDQKALKDIFNAAKEKGVLKEIVTEKIWSYQQGNTDVEFSLIDRITQPQFRFPSDMLNAIKESCGLEAFWKVISKNDQTNIKNKLKNKNEDRDRDVGMLTEDQNILKEIYQIEKSMSGAVKENSPSDGSATQPLKNEAKTKQATSKAMITGGVCGVIAALAVIGGCFAFGVQLPMLALIGIAVAAALVVGIVAGVITYAISEPSNKLDEPDSNKVASDHTHKK
ncbi:hypothetical protein [Wolbachia endosymbiont of Psylliodes chrysocephala]|uniref:hypothetical protein n=1 Tax=Wolbachia endosymbiont of Psylliodes chrysocephala TaxID=2883236 RepID=UPI00209CF755|nr:hypothetical protein [Wolbachia endosymbiont of Psylliodes chrysocephala]